MKRFDFFLEKSIFLRFFDREREKSLCETCMKHTPKTLIKIAI